MRRLPFPHTTPRWMGGVRWLAYTAGLRPKPGTILFSPSLSTVIAWRDFDPWNNLNLEDVYGQLSEQTKDELRRQAIFIEDIPLTCPPVPHLAERCAPNPTCGLEPRDKEDR